MNAWLYHRTAAPRLVTDDATFAELLAEGWSDTPAAFYAPVENIGYCQAVVPCDREPEPESVVTVTPKRGPGRPRKVQP